MKTFQCDFHVSNICMVPHGNAIHRDIETLKAPLACSFGPIITQFSLILYFPKEIIK